MPNLRSAVGLIRGQKNFDRYESHMTQALFQRQLNALRPTDAMSQEMLAKIKPGEHVRVEIKRMRNPRQHRLFWALMGMLANYAEHPCTAAEVSDWIKIAVGHTCVAHYPDGTSQVKPASIAFGNMSQDKWETFFNKVVDFACTKILHGTDNEALKQELNEMIAPRSAT